MRVPPPPNPEPPLAASPRVLSWISAMAEALALPLLLVRADGDLLDANMAGYRELAREQHLLLNGRRVVATRTEQREAFAACLIDSAATRQRLTWDAGGGQAGQDGTAAALPIVIAPVTGERRQLAEPMLMVVLPAEASAADARLLFAYQYGLSPGELEVLQGLCSGHSPVEIAATRGVSVSTVRTQMARLRRKCGLSPLQLLPPPPETAA